MKHSSKILLISGLIIFCIVVSQMQFNAHDTAPDSPAQSEQEDASVPAGEDATLQMAYSEAIGGDESAYHFQRSSSGYTASNPAHNLSVDVSETALTISVGEETWQLSSNNAAHDFTLNDNRLTIHRDGFDEWYVNGPVGLQQGFTLYEPAEIAFDVSGTLPTTASAQSLSLGNSLTFSGLMAYDANGQDVPVEFELEENELAYAYDDVGATYPLTIDPWLQQQKLTASDQGPFDAFGSSVAVSGDIALIAAPDKDCPGFVNASTATSCGTVYVFVRAGNTWIENTQLKSDGGSESFGDSLAFQGDMALISAPNDDCNVGIDCGNVFVFQRSGTSWTQVDKLTANDVAERDRFGWSVALSNNTAFIGSFADCVAGDNCGSVYVFTFDGTNWTEQDKLTADDADTGDFFGISTVIDGSTILIGAYGDNCGAGDDCGSVYVFTNSGGVWTQQAKLTAADADAGDSFGNSVALDGDTALIGAYNKNCTDGNGCGAAYVFTRSGNIWSQQAKLISANPERGDIFGNSVALEGDIAIVGAREENCSIGVYCGYVYVFSYDGTSWIQTDKFTSSDIDIGDAFGSSIALDSNKALVAAPNDKCVGGYLVCGSAYFFVLTTSLDTTAACNNERLEITISAGDGPFNITASAGINMPVNGVSTGTQTINGPEKWDDVTVTETTGDLESINLGQFKCRSDERPIPVWPPHRSHTTDAYPYFEWSPITDANNYRVRVWDGTVDIRQNSGGPTNLTLTQALNPGRYFWRVRGRQNRVWSLWSVRFTLFVDPVTSSFDAMTPAPAIELVVPPNSSSQAPPPMATQQPPDSGPPPTMPAPPNSR